jgi:8-oxo-dGTP pyrophosphatase MutT (NUDIX family)
MSYLGSGFVFLSHDLASILLVHDARSGKWGFPKGHRESIDNNNDIQTAIRETFEETGYSAEMYTIIPDVFKINKGSQSYLFRYAIVNDDLLKPAPRFNFAEIRETRWVSIKQLLEASNILDGNKYLRTWISDLQTNANKKSVIVFKTLLTTRLLPTQEPVSTTNVIACS